eukprot:Gb_23245 [translate_table: standard]
MGSVSPTINFYLEEGLATHVTPGDEHESCSGVLTPYSGVRVWTHVYGAEGDPLWSPRFGWYLWMLNKKGGLPKNLPLVQAIIIEDNDFPRVGRDVTAKETLVLSSGQMEAKMLLTTMKIDMNRMGSIPALRIVGSISPTIDCYLEEGLATYVTPRDEHGSCSGVLAPYSGVHKSNNGICCLEEGSLG